MPTQERITVIGSTNVDFVLTLARLPQPGEPVTDGTFLQTFGGNGANTALASARIGPKHKTTFITSLGDDLASTALIDSFRKDHVDVTHVHVRKNTATGLALLMLDRQGQSLSASAPGANALLSPADIDLHAAVIRTASLVVLHNDLRPDTLHRILALCDTAAVPVLFNYSPLPPNSATDRIPVSPQMAGLVLNETEASHLLSEPIHDIPSARHAATKLLTMGPRFVIVTLGDQGCVLKTADTDAHFPAYPITSPLKVVDTSAAGDTFVGALAVALVEGKKLPDAARFANLAAALTCTKIGTQASHPHPNRRRHPPFKVTCYFVAKINPPCSTGTWSGTSDCIEPA